TDPFRHPHDPLLGSPSVEHPSPLSRHCTCPWGVLERGRPPTARGSSEESSMPKRPKGKRTPGQTLSSHTSARSLSGVLKSKVRRLSAPADPVVAERPAGRPKRSRKKVGAKVQRVGKPPAASPSRIPTGRVAPQPSI